MALLEQASMYIHLDPRADAVQVPAWFKKQPQLVLQVGLNMAVRIPDLHVDEQGLSCTLSFNRSPFFCMIPWPAVFALVGENGQAMVWAEDVPAEVAAQAQAQKAPEKPRAHLRSVGDAEAPPAEATTDPDKKSGDKPGKARSSATTKSAAAKGEAKGKKGAARKTPAQKAPAAPQPEAAKKPAPAPQPAAAKAEPVAAKKTTAAKAAPARAPDGNKPKRELPPYLRVVK